MASDDAINLVRAAGEGRRPDRDDALKFVDAPLNELMAAAQSLTLAHFGQTVTYSRKVFIPLTRLCRDVCHYCTFAAAPRRAGPAYLSEDSVLEIARQGAAAGCKEALFTLGDRPEARYRAARDALASVGATSTLDYLHRVATRVHQETGLLPHVNAGVMNSEELTRMREVSVSMGLMLETAADRLSARGGPHYGSPDKLPAVRLATLREAGRLGIPFTSGLLVGIGETRPERIESLLALRDLHDEFGHLQELIIQNFRAKSGTRMAGFPEPSLEEQLWTISVTRLLFGGSLSVQAPPNLRSRDLDSLIRSGVNDWGGVSPVTIDHVNPEAPWPQLQDLEQQTAEAGRVLVQRTAIGPRWAQQPARWVTPSLVPAVLRMTDSEGYARPDAWHAGLSADLPCEASDWVGSAPGRVASTVAGVLAAAYSGAELSASEIVRLFSARGSDLSAVLNAADRLRAATVGETVTYVVNRNINYTNICAHRCGFCAFSKGRSATSLRGPAYDLELDEIANRATEAAAAGATEVCLQGGIHPNYTGDTYLSIVRAVKEAVPRIHVHAFSPLEVMHGSRTLGLPVRVFLERLREAGLASLPGTAAEILDDEVRAKICPDKLNTQEWLEVMRAAHEAGLRSTATIMFGHVEQPVHWANHLLRVRRLQVDTGGFTEFVPLPFVHREAPIWRRGEARSGPTLRESVLMHAVARLVLHPVIPNIQVSWVKMGREGAALCLKAGANDLGGTLMNESITRAAGGVNGQMFDIGAMTDLIGRLNRPAARRNTLYGRFEPTYDSQRDLRFITRQAAGCGLMAEHPPIHPTVESTC